MKKSIHTYLSPLRGAGGVFLLLLLVACGGPQPVENPQWQVSEQVQDNISTMTLAVNVSSGIAEGDLLAIFQDDICYGTAVAISSSYGYRFLITVFHPAKEDAPLTWRYYSDREHRIYYWHDALLYQQDAHIGLPSDPYVLDIQSATTK